MPVRRGKKQPNRLYLEAAALEYTQETVLWVHRLVGYATLFVIAPVSLLSFGGARFHPRWGKVYVWLMIFLYSTGTFMTLTRHSWFSWDFARNVTFNFFGFSMVLYGYRAIYLFRARTEPQPTRLDHILGALLVTSVLALLSVAVWRDTPMRVFTGVGILLCVLEVRDLRRGFKPTVMLLRRHIRYILASYYYFLTVVSIVHLDDELPRKAKWLWPTVVGAFVIYFASTNSVPALVRNPGKVLKWSVGITLITGVSFALYAAFELFRGTGFMGQAMVVAN